jgi:hypothetical protein
MRVKAELVILKSCPFVTTPENIILYSYHISKAHHLSIGSTIARRTFWSQVVFEVKFGYATSNSDSDVNASLYPQACNTIPQLPSQRQRTPSLNTLAGRWRLKRNFKSLNDNPSQARSR